MFNNQNEEDQNTTKTEESNETVVGNSVKLEGEFASQGNITIHGEVVGKVVTEREVHIGDTAVVKADVEAENIFVSGKVNGNLHARDRLEIKNTGKVKGDIQAKNLTISSGAVFSGNCSMEKEVEKKEVKEAKVTDKVKAKENQPVA
ncbi:MAG: polymer-forming cytoskeletal protein [bacterium]